MQQALNLLDDINQCSLPPTGIPLPAEIDHVMETLRARLAQPEPEPVAQVNYNERQNIAWLFGKQLPDGTLLYTAPPQREFVGLTDEEIMKMLDYGQYGRVPAYARNFVDAIEAKLKEKNHG
jgi:hypothetical protein